MRDSRTGGPADRRTDVTLTPSVARGKGPKARFVTGVAGILRTIAGMPDYEAHIEHLRRQHPEDPLPSSREYYESFLASRYGGGPTRCC
jgi:uncharacterized short protein YbdD (DUF466 family)